jgi:hypothetical protein
LPKANPVGQFDVELAAGIDVDHSLSDRKVYDVATRRSIGGDEVEVVARNFDTGGAIRESKADEGARRLVHGPFVLVVDDFGERPVGRLLLGNASDDEIGEGALDAYCNDDVGLEAHRIYGRGQSFKARVRKFGPSTGYEIGDDGKGCLERSGNAIERSVNPRHESFTVEDDQLTPEVLDGPEAHRAVVEQLAERCVAIEAAGHERIKSANLKRSVLFVSEVREPIAVQCIDVEGSEEPVVNDVTGHAEAYRGPSRSGSLASDGVSSVDLATIGRSLMQPVQSLWIGTWWSSMSSG